MVEIKRNITPAELLCGMGPACPAAYELTDGSLLVVGKRIEPNQLPADVSSRIGEDETAVVIPPTLLRPK